MSDLFKTCPNCGQNWKTQQNFILDKNLNLIGYTADFKKLGNGMFFFTHEKKGCNSTMVIITDQFKNLYNGPYYPENKANSVDCPQMCMKKDQLHRCDSMCECAFVREICATIKEKQSLPISS